MPGPMPATGVELTDQIPLRTGVRPDHTPSIGTFDPATGLLAASARCRSDSARRCSITARVLAAGTLINLAIKTAGDQLDREHPATTATAPRSRPSPVADIVVQKIVDRPGPPRVSESLTFTILVRNAGPSPATGVIVVDRLPPGLTFVSADPDRGTYDPVSGAWTIGDLAVDAAASMRYGRSSRCRGR